MFRKKQTRAGLTYISHGTNITGETILTGDALVGGEIHGKAHSESTITIEPQGLINGDVICQEMKVSGYFKGKLQCQKLIITNSGTVEGEVASDEMEIFEGGQFIGIRAKQQSELLPHNDFVDGQADLQSYFSSMLQNKENADKHSQSIEELDKAQA